MLKKTKLITIINHIFNITYTISCVIGVHLVLISIDHRSRAALENMKGGGGLSISSILHIVYSKSLPGQFYGVDVVVLCLPEGVSIVIPPAAPSPCRAGPRLVDLYPWHHSLNKKCITSINKCKYIHQNIFKLFL